MITVVGSVNLDLVARVARLPAAGETLAATGFTRVPGGKGANQALAARRLGAEVRLVAAVGAATTRRQGTTDEAGAAHRRDTGGGARPRDGDGWDAQASEALSLLLAGGVRLDGVRRAAAATTGLAMIQVDDAGETTIVVVPGANATLRVTAADLASADAVLTVLEVPVATVLQAAEHAPPGAFFALNAAPAPRQPLPRRLLDRADLVVVNRAEYAAIGMPIAADEAGTADETGTVAAARCVAVTHGAAGAVLLRGGVEVARATPPPVRAVDGTAAGDAFTAALVVALLGGTDDATALRRACAAGALAASRPGAQPSLPTAAEVDAILAR